MDLTETITDNQNQYRQRILEVIKEFRLTNNGFEELPYNYLSFIAESSRSIYGSLTSNRELLKFLDTFINEEHQCLDPWSFPGSFSTLLTRGIWSGYSRNEDDLKDWKELTAGKDHSAQSKYDRVIGFMPFMMKADSYNTKIKGAKKYYTSRFLTSIKNYLNNDAKVLVTFSKGEFNLFTDELSVNDGLCIKAVLSLPQYTWNQTSRESYLVWFELGIQGDFYVGELSDEKGRAKSIITSVESGGNKNVSLGFMVPPQRLGVTFKELQKEKQLDRFSKNNGWPIRKFSELTAQSSKPNFAFSYTPESSTWMAQKPNYIRAGELEVEELLLAKPKRAMHVYSLDESQVDLEYVKCYLEMGDPLIIGNSKEEFAIALPSIYDQSQIVECASKLDSLQTTITETQKVIFNPVKKLGTITIRVNNLTTHESLSFWISSLPFPISSILRIYIAEERPDKQVEALLYFFEALTQFLAIVSVSMLSSNDKTTSNFKPNWVEKNEVRKDWYKRASFGDWIALCRRLRKAVESKCALDQKGYNEYLEILGNPSQSFIDLISSKELYHLLEEANRKRNQWKGHGGITSDEENTERSKYLRRILEKLRSLSQGGLQEISVLKPIGSNFRKGVYTTSVEVLKGNETPFEKDKIESDIPLDEDELYLNIGNHNSPYLLLPFMRYNPSNKAVYFYSRLNNDTKTHWVTYNFPEVSSLDIDLDENFNDALLKFMKD